MWKLPSYVHKSSNGLYYIKFKIRHSVYEVHGFNNAMDAIQHKIQMESCLLNGNEYKNKIIRNPLL